MATISKALWKMTPIERLYRRVEPAEGCWFWNGAHSSGGYAYLQHTGKANRVIRLIYEAMWKDIDEGMVLDHLCSNVWCISPSHLEEVTPQVNTLRGGGPASLNAKKTECLRGHDLTPENTYIRKDRTGRYCKQCISIRDKQYLERKRG